MVWGAKEGPRRSTRPLTPPPQVHHQTHIETLIHEAEGRADDVLVLLCLWCVRGGPGWV